MKVAITGHTRGIGKALADYFAQQGHEVKGFSRSNGYQLPKHYMNVITEARDCDVFVNNAHAGEAQSLILTQLCQFDWVKQNKKIVNICSLAALTPIHHQVMYAAHKAALMRVVEQFQSKQALPHIININPGLIDTPNTANNKSQKMSVADVVSVVDFCLKFPHAVLDLTFRHKDAFHPITY
jgi:NAD(P)-dependent dehydrogenase (short-subunit alcohol dehydrogenase family)